MKRVQSKLHAQVRRLESALRDLEDDSPELFELIDGCFDASHGLLRALIDRADLGIEILLYQTIDAYVEDAFLFAVAGRFDQSNAMLRMATELTRDLLRIRESPALLDVFVNRQKRANEYREKFRFAATVPNETRLASLYKICSAYGVHGHLQTNGLSEFYDYEDGGRIAVMKPPPEAIFRQLIFCLSGLELMITLRCDSFVTDAAEFDAFRQGMTDVLPALRRFLDFANRELKKGD